MWYTENSSSLDLNKPIFAKNKDDLEARYILLPQMVVGGNYKHAGYNWFNIKKGDYNSSRFYETPEEAISSYSSYDIFNGTLSIQKAY